MMAIRWHSQNQLDPSQGDYWETLGYFFGGPAIYAYAVFLNEYCVKNNVKKLGFMARDGYMIQKVFDIIKTGDVKTEYIYATRTILTLTELNYSIDSRSQMKAILDYYGLNEEQELTLESDSMRMLSKIYENQIYLEQQSFKEMQKYRKYLESF